MDREKKRIWNLPEDSEEEEELEEESGNAFATDGPITASSSTMEKWGISEEELRGEEPSDSIEEEELEESEWEGATFDELRESESFREAWRKTHKRKKQEYESKETEEKLQAAELMEKRGGSWAKEAERLRSEVEPSEAEKIGREVAKRINDSSGQAEELESINQPEETEEVDDSAFVTIEHSDTDWTVFTDDEKAIEELEELSNREDSVSIISQGDYTMECRIQDTSALPFNN